MQARSACFMLKGYHSCVYRDTKGYDHHFSVWFKPREKLQYEIHNGIIVVYGQK